MLGHGALSQLPLSGTPSVSGVSYSITCSSGAYTYTGQSITVNRNRSLTTNSGSYLYTGSSISVLRNRVLIASSGSYVYTGSAISVIHNIPVGYTLTALSGSYNLSGQNIVVSKSKNITLNQGVYSYSGQSISINKNRALVTTSGSYTYTGSYITVAKSSVYPDPSVVLLGTVYGPSGMYVGTFDAISKNIKLDITTGNMVKPINDKVVITL